MRVFSKALNHNPVTRYVKNYRNKIINWYFMRKNAPNLEEFFKKFEKGDSVVFSIAFNTPVCVEIMIDAWTEFAQQTKLAIIDNSSDLDASKKIAKICFGRCPYLRLPHNPEWHPCRSHALAMNWTYNRVVKTIKPKYFGFLDHDCFPFASFNLSEKMGQHSIYGEKRDSEVFPCIWNLWAGFCFFEFEHFVSKSFDFTHRVELGLDTGGSNWLEIYQYLDESALLFAERGDRVFENSTREMSNFIIIDDFIHFGSGSRKDKGNPISLTNFKHVMSQMSPNESTYI
jgi:hypothetical protein